METESKVCARRLGGAWIAGLLMLGLAPDAPAQRNLSVAPAATAEQRIALVIGNSKYPSKALTNPANDAGDIAQALTQLGFKVTLRRDATHRQMVEAINEFGNQLRKGGTGLFYFAGHGIESNGRNYLLPVAPALNDEAQLEFDAVDANRVLAHMEQAGNSVNIVILDACRDNPYSKTRFRSTATRGLARMDAPKGSFVAFATSPGSVASDGDGKNGVFTHHLLASLRQPDTDINRVFERVAKGVSDATGGKQVPWRNTSLLGAFYFRDGDAVASASPGAFQVDPRERAIWDSVKDTTNPADFDLYLNRYPSGYYSELARSLKGRLEGEVSLREEERRKAAAARKEEEQRLARLREEDERRRVQEAAAAEAAAQEDEARRQRQQQQRAQEAQKRREAEQKGRAGLFAPTF